MDGQIPADAFYDLTEITDFALSPDGSRLAFVAEEFEPGDERRRSSVFLVPTDGSRPPHRLTRVGTAHTPKWTSNGRRLGVLASRPTDAARLVGTTADDDPEPSDDQPATQLWVFDVERGGDAVQVTDREAGVTEFDWGPDGSRAVISSRDPTDDQQAYVDQRENDGPIETERLQHKFDGHGWLDEVRSYLFVVDVESGERQRLDDAYGAGAAEPMVGLQPAWQPDGERIAFVSNREDRPDDSFTLDVYTISADGSDRRQVTDGEVMARRLAWSPSGDRLAFVGQSPTNWYDPPEVYVASPEAGTSRSVTSALDRTVPWSAVPRWLDENSLVIPVGDGGTTRLARLSVGGAAERTFDWQGTQRSIPMVDARGDTVVCLVSDPRAGADLHAMRTDALDTGPGDDDPLTRLTAVNEELIDEYETPGVSRITVVERETTGAEFDVEAIARYPAAFDPENPDPRPLILSVHGGPQWYDAPRFEFDTRFWTSRGYIVLGVNYRGSTSYGRAFCEALRGEWGELDVADLGAGVLSMIDQGWADPDRAFATGFSYGGIATARLLQHTDLFAAGAAEHGIYDRRSSFGTDDAHVWWTNQYGLPWTDAETYNEGSTVSHADDVEDPLLLMAGGDDWRCPPTQAEQLYVSLKKTGTPSKLVVYPDEHHDIDAPDRAVHRLKQLEAWFERFDPGRSDK